MSLRSARCSSVEPIHTYSAIPDTETAARNTTVERPSLRPNLPRLDCITAPGIADGKGHLSFI
jgi:hypothetical protein